MPTQNVCPPKHYFKNITASPDFYPNDPESFSAKMSNTAHRAVSKPVPSDFNATRYRKSTQMSKHLAHLLNGSFQYWLPNLQDDKQALRAAASMGEDQLVRHRVLGLLRDPMCAQGWERKRGRPEGRPHSFYSSRQQAWCSIESFSSRRLCRSNTVIISYIFT